MTQAAFELQRTDNKVIDVALPIASNCNILLADKSEKMVVVECMPSIKQIREAETFENGNIVCIVNSFTSDVMKSYDDAHGNDYNSHNASISMTVLSAWSLAEKNLTNCI